MTSPGTPPGRAYVASLTGLRGIAALAVVLYHFRYFNAELKLTGSVSLLDKLLHYPFAFGFAGVDLFFVLSGFLLTLPFAAAQLGPSQHPALGRYFQRRVLRVFPAYYAQLGIILVVGAWFLSWRSLGGYPLLGHTFMFFHIGPNPVQPLVGVWWTLPVELSFYLLLPFLVRFMTPRRWIPVLAAGLLLSVSYRYWAAGAFSDHGVVLQASQLPGSLPEFLLGVGAAILVQSRRHLPGPGLPAWRLDQMFLLALLLIWLWHWQVVLPNGVDYWKAHWSMLIAPIVLGSAMATMVWCTYQGSRIATMMLANRAVYALGLISYSLYLWHFVVLQQLPVVLGDVYSNLALLPRFVVAIAVVVAVATASYFLFERPFLRLGARTRPSQDENR